MPAAKNMSTALSNPVHLLRFLKAQAGMTPAEVAKQERVTPETIKHSISLIESYQNVNTKFQLDLAFRDLIISSIPQAKETFQALLAATEMVEVKNSKTGRVRVVSQVDKVTRLEALRILNSLMGTTQPKGPMIEQKIQQTTQVAASATTGETNEERFRRLKAAAAQHNALPPEVAAVPDYIDKGGTADDEEDDDEEEEDDEKAI
jgi:hypothetical protein